MSDIWPARDEEPYSRHPPILASQKQLALRRLIAGTAGIHILSLRHCMHMASKHAHPLKMGRGTVLKIIIIVDVLSLLKDSSCQKTIFI
jgi:hypothetical protein